MKTPQPIAGGKSILSGLLLKIVTGTRLMLNGEVFWLLTKRLPDKVTSWNRRFWHSCWLYRRMRG